MTTAKRPYATVQVSGVRLCAAALLSALEDQHGTCGRTPRMGPSRQWVTEGASHEVVVRWIRCGSTSVRVGEDNGERRCVALSAARGATG